MKSKIVFFFLGAMVATMSYLAGDLTLTADSQGTTKVFEGNVFIKGHLWVDEQIIVGYKGSDKEKPYIQLKADDKRGVISLGDGHGRDGHFIMLVSGEVAGSSRSQIMLNDQGKSNLLKVD